MAMRKFVLAMLAMVSMLTLAAPPATAGEDSTANANESNAELRHEMRAMSAQMSAMEKRMEAMEAQIAASSKTASGAAAGTTPATTTTANASTSSINAVPPGITPAGVPLGSSSGETLGSALRSLVSGPVTGPQAPTMGANADAVAPNREGVIIPSIQGVPKIFIPDIGAVGDFALQQSDYHKRDPRYHPSADKFAVRDTQIILFSPIDPYTNAQISIDKPNNGPFDIEEAFVSFNKLPHNIQVRAGQFRPVFGLLNETDTFQLPIANRPEALARYLTQDGFVEPGVNVSAYVPNPWEAPIKLDVNLLSGLNSLAFDRHNGNNYDFAYVGTLSYSRDLMSSGYLTAGGSFAGGPGRGGQAYYGDPFVQVQYAPDQRHIWTLDAEGLIAEQQGVGNHGLKRGVYSLLDYNFWLRYHAAFLLDIVDRPDVASGTEVGLSPALTWFLSDNTRFRAQYTHTTPSGPERLSNVFFLQATFALGNLKPLD